MAPCKGSVNVWTPVRVLELLNRHPHLALSITSMPSEGLRTYDEWSRSHDMSHAFKSGDEEGAFVRRLRECLLDDNSLHIRVTGEPGAGKTRLVLEAIRDDRLRDRVVYADGPDPVWPMLHHINMGGTDDNADMIIVVDDCRRLEQAQIWNEMRQLKGMRLVTIHSEEDEDRSDTLHMPVPPLRDAQLREIISTYVQSDRDLGEWVEYCRASPRAAHIVGENLKSNPDDMLRSPSTVAVWDRYIAGQNDPRGGEYEARKTVLEWLSLFKTFGYGDAYGRELDRIASLVEKNARMSKDKFLSTVRTLRRMKVLQGTSMLYITPKILHVYMWVEWWRDHTPDMAPQAGDVAGRGEGARGTQRLLQWYLDMFRYARHSPEASKVVETLLRPGGFLDSDQTLKSGLGADFFLTLSTVDPDSSLACIGRIIDGTGAGSPAELGGVHPTIVHALEQMLSRGVPFAGVARILLRFAVAGGGVDAALERAPNPPLDAYCSALDPSNPRISAPLRDRLASLRRGMGSDSAEERRVAVRACGHILAMRRRSIAIPRCGAFEHVPDPWVPGDRGEAVGYYVGVLGLLRTAALESGDGRLRREAADAAVGAVHQAALVPELSQPAVELLEGLVALGAANRDLVLDKVAVLLDAESDRIAPAALERLSSLRDSMDGGGFSAELRRRVGRHAPRGLMSGWRGDRAAGDLGALADAAMRDGVLLPELEWLVTGEAVDGLRFGREVAQRDPGLLMLDPALAAMRRAGPSATALFLGGYLQRASEGGLVDLDGMLDRLLADAALRRHAPDIAWRIGMTRGAVERIAQGVSDGKLGIESLQPLRCGRRLRGISAEAVAGLVGQVLEKCGLDDRAGATALDMLCSRFVGGPGPESSDSVPIPERLALGALLHPGLVGPADGPQPDHVTCGAWRSLAVALAAQDGGGALDLAEAMIDRFGDSALLRFRGPDPPSGALAEIAVRRPREVWPMIASRLVPALDKRARALLEWIRDGGRSSRGAGADRLAAALMPGIIAWVGEDPDGRAEIMSRHLPPGFSPIRDFVARFGRREDVRDALAARLVAGTYGGSVVSHYADKKRQAERLAEGEEDPSVLSFLAYYAAALDGWMEEAAPAKAPPAAGGLDAPARLRGREREAPAGAPLAAGPP